MGYQVTTVTPANMELRAAAALPSMMILPAVAFIFHAERVRLAVPGRRNRQGERSHVQLRCFRLALAELLEQGFAHLLHIDAEQVGQNPVIDHIADELQLGFGTNGPTSFVEGNR